MGTTCKVSVVIPVYNAEKYLGQMLDSVLAQTLKEIEVICVNDGSDDRSAEIVQSYRKRDGRIRYLTQEKQNAGAARNLGLSHAQGDYIVFWDADDRFDQRALALMYRKMERLQADICVCSANEFTDDGKPYETGGYLKTELLPRKDPFSRQDMPEHIFHFATNFVWNKMFRRRFLLREKLQFQEIPQANDTAFVMQSMYLAKRITYVQKNLVSYRVNNRNSLTGRASETLFCPYESYLFTLQQLKKQPDFSACQKGFCSKAVRGMLRALDIQTSFLAYQRLYDFLQKEGLGKLELNGCLEADMEEPWLYRDLKRIQTMPAEEFLLCKANERRWERDRLKYTIRRVRRRLALLFWANRIIKHLIDKNYS